MNRTVVLTRNQHLRVIQLLTERGVQCNTELLQALDYGHAEYAISASLSMNQETILDSILMTARCEGIDTDVLDLHAIKNPNEENCNE